MSDEKEKSAYTTRIVVEMDETTKEWILALQRKYNCNSYRELVFLALKFLDETPYDKMPFEMRGIVQKRGEKISLDSITIRWMQIERLQHEIDNFLIRTNKDKETLTKMIGELRKLLNDHAKDKASALLKELEQLKREMQEGR